MFFTIIYKLSIESKLVLSFPHHYSPDMLDFILFYFVQNHSHNRLNAVVFQLFELSIWEVQEEANKFNKCTVTIDYHSATSSERNFIVEREKVKLLTAF
jgi:hypothetical protein